MPISADVAVPLLRIENLVGGYGGRSILNGVTLSAHRHEIVCLIGQNGAGKSTILRAIYNMLPQFSGSITFEAAPTDGLKPHQLLSRGIAYVPQNHSIFPKLTIAENLRLGAYRLRDATVIAARQAEVEALFPILRERRAAFAGTLSGGEQRMLEVARALMMHPKLIMLDEPSIGLAPKMIDLVFDTVGVLRDQGICVILVEQNVRKALAISDRACVLELGTIALEDTASALLGDRRMVELYMGGQA